MSRTFRSATLTAASSFGVGVLLYVCVIKKKKKKHFSLLEFLNTSECQCLINFTLPNSPFISFKLTTPNLTLFKCNRSPNITSSMNFKDVSCGEYDLYFNILKTSVQLTSSCCVLLLGPFGMVQLYPYTLVNLAIYPSISG